ncbi:MAG: hypothetical protein D6733_03455 [Methanobacteriota archaeon]|nr:MAG: hypothetical protein D6733_03455 [Euryarchaeota archaeon]
MEAIEKDIKEIKGMLSDLSELMLKVLDMEIEPVREEELTEEEKEGIEEIIRGRAELLTKEEFEKSLP